MRKSVNDKNYQDLLNYLKAARKEQDLTVRDVAALIGENNQLVSKIENGNRKLSVSEYVQYCEGIGINPFEGLKLLCEYDWEEL